MSDLTSLRERIGKATGADRELDGMIAITLGGFSRFRNWFEDDARTLHAWHALPAARDAEWVPLPAYTSSLDAALGLVEAKVKDAAQAQTIFHKAVRAWSSWALMHRAEMGFDQLPRFVLSALLSALSDPRP